MSNAITDLIASSPKVVVDLLTSPPTSQDPETWARPQDGNYYGQRAQLVLTNNQLPGGLTFQIDVIFPPAIEDWEIVAVGVTCRGQYITHNLLPSPRTWSSRSAWNFQIFGSVQPVQNV
jgi:hypothetical protein